MQDPAAYKKALIDWLLSVGKCASPYHTTPRVLDDFAARGVDYEASEMPEFQMTETESSGTFAEATREKTLSAKIVPAGRRDGLDAYRFFVDPDELDGIMLGFIIQGVANAAEAGDEAWKGRNARERREFEEQCAAWDAERGKA